MGSRVQTSAVCTRELGYTIIVMARYSALWLVATIATAAVTGTPARKSEEIAEYDDYYDSDTPVAVTCPGFPGYCSESYVGDTCTVVCARGRNNVPQCQEDGTWTDIPRCIEHEPGVEEQVTGICPGIPGYCSLDWPGALCEFECSVGPKIRSSCTPDGTWDPYPTCEGDPRESQDGCNPCPGPDGGPRNRTAETGGRKANEGSIKSSKKGARGNTKIPKNAAKRNKKIPRNGSKKQVSGGNRRPSRNRGGSKQGSQRNKIGGHRGNGKGNQNDRNQGRQGHPGGKLKVKNRVQPPKHPRRQSSAPSIPSELTIPPPSQRQHQPSISEVQSRERTGQLDQTKTSEQSTNQCPGEELQACIDVCPGFSVKVFGACVRGCAKRCPSRK